MAYQTDRTQSIRNFIVKNVVEHPTDICSVACEEFGLSRQSITRHLKNLVEEGILVSSGRTRAREYQLRARSPRGLQLEIQVDNTLEEDEVWRSYIRPQLEGASENVIHICEYGFTEMLNNVIDHSQSERVVVSVKWEGDQIQLFVADKGVGIFSKLQSELGFSDPRHAILELSKGKLTTNSSFHTGEGIFFTSKMFDTFFVGSEGIAYRHGYKSPGIVTDFEVMEGTGVAMWIKDNAPQTMNEVFEEFAAGADDFGFNKTWLTLGLAQFAQENLVSRSQAKRVLARIEQFHEVVLDFDGVANIGPSFADEIFRVFANEHPEVQLLPIRTSREVERAIKRAEARRS